MGAHAWSERKHARQHSSRSDLIARRTFRALPPADYGESDTETEQDLLKLGAAMVAPHDDPKDGPDAEESGIPAAYTYLGQFVDHGLTFNPESSLQWGCE
jgi:hypothetical protein